MPDKEFSLGFVVSKAIIEDDIMYQGIGLDHSKWISEKVREDICFNAMNKYLNNEEPMLTAMDKLVLDSMIQNDETVETMIFVLYQEETCDPAAKYLYMKALRKAIEVYINE